MSRLVIRYVPDAHDEVGQLWFELLTDNFSGSGFFWSDLSEWPSLIGKFRAYPLTETVSQSWGYNAREGDDAVLALSVSPGGPIEASITVADLYFPQQRLTATLRTDYPSLNRMLLDLAVMIERREGDATLLGF